ncbi:hypothetical protein D1872_38440 [compost metagenome]
MANDISTLQSNIRQPKTNMESYSLFMGGLNAKNGALAQYSPLKTGYARIFFVRMPAFMKAIMPNKTKSFRHIMEYGFTGVDGIQNLTMDYEQMTGGYSGRSLDVATVAKDETNEITVKLYEFQGSPVREYTNMWLTGISDPYTGLGHYHGAMDRDATLQYSQANHTAEAIYVQTDPTGRENGIEYACMITNMMPKSVKMDHFNYEAGTHAIVQTDVTFTALKYESPQINEIAKALIARYKVMRDYLEFQSGFSIADVNAMPVPTFADTL